MQGEMRRLGHKLPGHGGLELCLDFQPMHVGARLSYAQ
jgi:hypothetical protein